MVMFILFSSETFAGIKRICKVKYETDYGWSKEYKVEVTFMTGKELNKATSSFQYSSFSNYCLIWFDNDEVAILEIKTFLMSVGDEFDRDDFINAFQITSDISCTQVNNESKTKWKIIAKEFISFIDPIENE
jgi:hypothetical protein